MSQQRQNRSIRDRVGQVVVRRRNLLPRAAATAVFGVAGIAGAQNVWIGPAATPSSWENSANWSLGNVPNGDVAFVNNGGIATISSSVPETLALQVGSDAGFSGTVIQEPGSGLKLTQVLVLGGSANPVPTAAGAGTYTMNGGTLSDADNFVGAKGAGTFNMNGGTLISTGHMRLGDDQGATGVLNMTGGVITLPGFLLVGHGGVVGSPVGGIGTANISGGTLNVANYTMGQHPTARGTVRQTGGYVNNTAHNVIGEISRQPNLNDVSGGTLRVAQSIWAGSSDGIGEFRLSGTGNAQVNGDMNIGSGTNSIGTVVISGGTLSLGFLSGSGVMVVGQFGKGTTTITGGETNVGFMQLGRQFNSTSQGQVTQTGGAVNVRRSMNVGGLSPNDNFYNMTGGTLSFTNTLGGGTNTFGETLPGLHVARFSVNPGTLTAVTGYSKGRLTIDGTANVVITGGLHNSTGFNGVVNDGVGTATVALPGGAGLIGMKAGTLTAGSFLNGGNANAGTFNNGGAWASYVQTGGTATVGHVTGTGTVAVSAGTMNVKSLRQAGATISGTGQVNVALDGTDAGVSRLGSLTMSVGNGTLDLADNDLIVVGGATQNQVEALVASARNNGAWDQSGITSSAARNNAQDNTGLGVLSGAELNSVGGTGTFSGQSYAPSDTLVKYTWNGDANLNGVVNFDDYVRTDVGFNTNLTGWVNGDFNYSGGVNFDDYVLLDVAFNTQSGTLGRAVQYLTGEDRSSDGMGDPSLQEVTEHFGQFGGAYASAFLAAVPEPTTFAILGVPALAAVVRRRRRRQTT